ncbi:MAG: S-layer homology domain-containing protein, partial [Clostridia bacterium]|nr:S-layer homology domain-containing protein [Clostridia bacterium]
KISPETTKVEKGDNQKFEIKADKGYEVEKVLVDGKSVGAVTEYTFEKVKEKHTIEATFKKVEEVTEETWKNPFIDVTEDDWFYEAVKYANENKLFNGVSSTEFGPNVSMTRAMLVTVLYRLEGEPATNRSIPFADVDMSMYYANAVIWAKQNNIVNGVDENNFAPDREITREQLVTILYRFAQYKGKDVSVGENTNILSYDDVSQVSEYAIPAMQWACGSGIITGRTTATIAPKGTATRAEVATMLMRFVK